MTDIFISYSRKDKPWVDKLAAALQAQHYSVWWDVELLPGQNFEEAIRDVLDDTRCVVTVWSKASVDSLWVKDESSKALKRNALVPVMYQATDLPMPFGRIHTADLQGWEGDPHDPRFRQLLKAIAQHCPPTTTDNHNTINTARNQTVMDWIKPRWKWLSTTMLAVFVLTGGYNDIKGVVMDISGEFQAPAPTLTFKSDGKVQPGNKITLLYTAPSNGYLSLWNLDAASDAVDKLLPLKGMGTLHLNPEIQSASLTLTIKPGSDGTDKYILLWTPEATPDHLPFRHYATEAAFSAAVEVLESQGNVAKQTLDVPIYP